MDGLTPEERAETWTSTWEHSLVGLAIVNPDFTFRAVNPQFCEVLGITPAQVLGLRVQDISTRENREVDEKNGRLLMAGLTEYYLLKKTYDFGAGLTKNVILLVTRIPKVGSGDFKYFLLHIVPAVDNLILPPAQAPRAIELHSLDSDGPTRNERKFAEWWEYWWPKVALGTAGAAALIASIIQKIAEKK